MTRSLLYPPSPEDAVVDAFAPGLDMVPATDLGEAAGFRCTVRCDRDLHEVLPGEDCPHCGENPKCEGCPGRLP